MSGNMYSHPTDKEGNFVTSIAPSTKASDPSRNASDEQKFDQMRREIDNLTARARRQEKYIFRLGEALRRLGIKIDNFEYELDNKIDREERTF